jgi:hypothetical protein
MVILSGSGASGGCPGWAVGAVPAAGAAEAGAAGGAPLGAGVHAATTSASNTVIHLIDRPSSRLTEQAPGGRSRRGGS